jgi:transcriptional regulator with XRE-family HTH domain
MIEMRTTQAKLAQLVNSSQPSVSRIVRGRIPPPQLRKKISKALKSNETELFRVRL